MAATGHADHARLMDGVYRHQRHFYDLTRKYYLLGRDRLIAGLDVPAGGAVLELGCGTGRNLRRTARAYPDAALFGIDISRRMLETAERGNGGRIRFALADATDFDAGLLFGRTHFDRVYLSYALSMIPAWERAIDAGLAAVAPGGTLAIVDFGRQEGLPHWFGSALHAWLARFHVEPRATLPDVLAAASDKCRGDLRVVPLHRGYAVLATITKPVPAGSAPRPAGETASRLAPTRR